MMVEQCHNKKTVYIDQFNKVTNVTICNKNEETKPKLLLASNLLHSAFMLKYEHHVIPLTSCHLL